MFYGELKLLILAAKTPRTGDFALVDKAKKGNYKHILVAGDWYHCREYFHAVNKGHKRWLYCHRAGYSYKIASFIHEVEKRLKLKEFTVFGPTQLNRVSWVDLSSFWFNGSIRRSLFTILLRAGQRYIPWKNNFLECVEGERYLADTMYAFNRFLSGYTAYTGYTAGWYKQFRWSGPPEVREVTNSLGRKMKYKVYTRTLVSQIKRLLVKTI